MVKKRLPTLKPMAKTRRWQISTILPTNNSMTAICMSSHSIWKGPCSHRRIPNWSENR
jgi:hypothetical protein